jgi:hypothetical protein
VFAAGSMARVRVHGNQTPPVQTTRCRWKH